MFRLLLISTGGTIEKTYDELAGVMTNHVSVLDVMIGSLDLRGVTITRQALMNKDSLEMTAQDHQDIAEAAFQGAQHSDGILIVHGTDRLAVSGETVWKRWSQPNGPHKPVVLTGAMRPYEMRRTDAVQNLTESLIAVQILPPGVFVVMHNKVLSFPGVTKDLNNGTFVKTSAQQPAAGNSGMMRS